MLPKILKTIVIVGKILKTVGECVGPKYSRLVYFKQDSVGDGQAPPQYRFYVSEEKPQYITHGSRP